MALPDFLRTASDVHIRWLIRRDLAEVLSIDAHGFASRWTEDDFLRRLRQPMCIGMVGEACDRVVGFMVYDLLGDHIDLIRLAVAPDWRGRGVGRQFVEKLTDKLTDKLTGKRGWISVQVRESNLAGQQFLASCGFRATRVERDAFADTHEDAYHFLYRARAAARR